MSHCGGCLCGGVRYAIGGELKDPVACHCSQCARTSGHFAAMSACPKAALEITASDTLKWYVSSQGVRRGFCDRCGGNVLWCADAAEEIYVTAGSLDRPTGVKLAGHIFVASIADYYELTDALPRKPEW